MNRLGPGTTVDLALAACALVCALAACAVVRDVRVEPARVSVLIACEPGGGVTDVRVDGACGGAVTICTLNPDAPDHPRCTVQRLSPCEPAP